MRISSCCFAAVIAVISIYIPSSLYAQNAAAFVGVAEMPEAPLPQVASLGSSLKDSTSSTPAKATISNEKSQHDIAEKQIKEAEKQRLLGVLPSFNVSYRFDAVSLTAGQKLRLAFRGAIDPATFGTAFLVAGYSEGMHDNIGFPWGAKGVLERTGAAYLDIFDGSMIGTGILPALLHQDPRYFRMGHGSTVRRTFYAIANNFVCKHDKSGRWEPNYSNMGGNISAGALSNFYYPSSGSSVGKMFANGAIVTIEGGMGTIVNEFWPDISRKLLHKDPTHGLDAQMHEIKPK
jgi:hypothetical protein